MQSASTHSRQAGGRSLVADMVKGVVAGAAAVWIMDRVDWFMYEHEAPEARHRTQKVRPRGMDPAHVAVNKAAEMLGTELSPHQPHPAGVALHYSIGIGPAALYATMRDRAEGLGIARGPLYGLGLFLVQDEAINAISGLSARPGQYPWQAHARGLVAHIIYGFVTDMALNALDVIEDSVRQSQDKDEGDFEAPVESRHFDVRARARNREFSNAM